MGKIFNVILNIILVLIILLGGLVVFTALPIAKNYSLFIVQSGSMEPAIHTGSLIFVKSRNDYNVGDIVTRVTKDEKVTVTHRIINKEEAENGTTFKTKGDANDTEDSERFSEDDIIGKVFLIIPYLGYPVNYAKTSTGVIILIVIPAVIIVYEELQKIYKEIAKKVDYRKRMKKREETLNSKEEKNDKEKNDEEN